MTKKSNWKKKVAIFVTFLKFWTCDFEMSYLHIPRELESQQYIIRQIWGKCLTY